MRKLLSLLLVVLMVFSLGVPAYATTTDEDITNDEETVVDDAGEDSGEGTEDSNSGGTDEGGGEATEDGSQDDSDSGDGEATNDDTQDDSDGDDGEATNDDTQDDSDGGDEEATNDDTQDDSDGGDGEATNDDTQDGSDGGDEEATKDDTQDGSDDGDEEATKDDTQDDSGDDSSEVNPLEPEVQLMQVEEIPEMPTIDDGTLPLWGENVEASWFFNSKPEARNVRIDGTNQLGEILTGSYDYYDQENDPEFYSETWWYADGHKISGTRNEETLEVTQDLICKDIQFKVKPRALMFTHFLPFWWIHEGHSSKSKPMLIEEPNFWITVDDGYELYINGEFIDEDPVGVGDPDPNSWKTVDYYYLPDYEPGELTIAVKGMDQSEGSATIAGFIAAYNYDADCDDCQERCIDHWLITDDNWFIYRNETPPEAYDGIQWYEEDYKGLMKEEVLTGELRPVEENTGWEHAYEIKENPWPNGWPVNHEYLEKSGAEWIWSDIYKTTQEDPFDSPVYFRNTLELLSPPEAQDVAISGDNKLGETLTGSYTYYDPDGEPEGDSILKWYMTSVLPTASVGPSIKVEIGEGETLLLDDHNYLNGSISFEVTPVSEYDPKEGETVPSDSITLEEPHVWVVAYDDYTLYIDGEWIGEDTSGEPEDGSDVDYYYLEDPPMNPLIAVKAWMTNESLTDDSGLKLAYRNPVQAAEGIRVMDEWIITDGSWKTYTGNEPPIYENLDPDLHWYHPDYKGEDWVDAYSLGQSPDGYLTHNYLDPTMAHWIWTENNGYSGLEPRGTDLITVDTPVYFRTDIELYDADASVLGITDDDLLLGESTTVHVQLFNEESGIFIPNDPLLYTVEFFLDGVSIGTGTFDSNDDRYELTFEPPFSEYAQIVSAKVNGVDVNNTVQLTVSKTPLEIVSELTLDNSTIYDGDELKATVTVKDQYGDYISGEIIEIMDDSNDPMATVEVSPGIHEITYIPVGLGMHTVTYTVSGNLASEEDYFEVINVIETLEHGPSVTGDTELEDKPYKDLALFAQLTTFDMPAIGMLRSDIIEDEVASIMNGGPEVNYKSNDFYSYVETHYMTPSITRVEDPEYPLNYLASETGVIKDTSGKIIGVVGHEIIPTGIHDAQTNGIGFHVVDFKQPIENPVVLAHLGSDNWLEEVHARVVDIHDEMDEVSTDTVSSATGFGVILEPNEYINSVSMEYEEPGDFEVISYLVIEEGVHQVGDVYIEASKLSGYFSNTTHTFSQHYYMPSVFSQTQTYDNHVPRWMRENNITSNTVDLTLQRAPHNFVIPVDEPSEAPMAIQEYPEELAVVLVADNLVHEVTFTNTFASTFDPQMVEHGTTASNPGTPSRSGYTFTGWTLEGSSFNIATDVVLEDIELVATWSSTGGGGGGGGGTTTTATINAVNDSLVTSENTPVSVTTTELMANDTDADDFESVQNPINGSVTLSGNTVTFTPATDFVGTAYFSYTISDGGDEDNGLVSVTVEELVEINPFETPLGGDPNALILINPEETPLGAIDYSLPYVIGYPDQSFKPNRQITRGEMAAIFARILRLDTSNPGDPIYADVKPDDWYYKYVQTVSRMGIFGGYEGNEFKPNRPITHAEIASAFSEYWDLKGIEISNAGGTYSDVEGHWAEDAINRFFNAGISVGFIDGTFKPNAFTTRAELVVMVNRTLNRPELVDVEPSFPDVQPNFWGFGAIEAASKRYQGESAIKE